MCYYNGQRVTRVEFIELKRLEKKVKNYDFLDVGVHNGFEHKPCAILVPNEDCSDFEIVQMEWGFIPYNVRDRAEATIFQSRYLTMNAKAENLFLNDQGRPSMWADAARNRRGLMLSTGIYEYRHVFPMGKKGVPLKTAVKYPYHVSVKERPYFFMPAVWQEWTDRQTGETVLTGANTTTMANTVMRQIHNSKERMPTILTDDLAWEWMMSKELSEARITEIALTQVPSSKLDFCTVDKAFRASAAPESPFEYADLAPIDLTYADTEKFEYPTW